MSNEAVTTITCEREEFDRWRAEGSTLPAEWRHRYPQLFDDDDLVLASGPQRKNHFAEWFAAIYLFQRDGSCSLVEKFDTYESHFRNRLARTKHLRKIAEYQRVVPETDRAIPHDIGTEFRVQLPDLLVIAPDGGYSFAEVKGPTDNTLNRENQRKSRDAIRTRRKVPVEVIKIRLAPAVD